LAAAREHVGVDGGEAAASVLGVAGVHPVPAMLAAWEKRAAARQRKRSACCSSSSWMRASVPWRIWLAAVWPSCGSVRRTDVGSSHSACSMASISAFTAAALRDAAAMDHSFELRGSTAS